MLIAPAKSSITAKIEPGFPLASLLGDGRLAMCDPAHDPAGRHGRASLEALGVWPHIADHVAIAENVRGVVAMVARGEAPLAIVFATDAIGNEAVKVVGSFPDETHPPIRYPVAITAASQQPDAANFLAFLSSPAGIALFERFGYLTLP